MVKMFRGIIDEGRYWDYFFWNLGSFVVRIFILNCVFFDIISEINVDKDRVLRVVDVMWLFFWIHFFFC